MATPITNTQITDDTVGLREDLSDIIAKTDPVDTPLYSNSAKVAAKATLHQWQEWVIEESPPVTIDYKLEGEEPDRNAAVPTTRLNNPCSILSRDYIVSGTLVSTDVAGRPSEMAWQKITRGLELRAQVETALLADNVKVPTNLPRENAGLPNYADSGDGSAVNTIVTPAHTPTDLENAMVSLKANGAVGRTCLMLPASKVQFSSVADTGTAKNVEASSTEGSKPRWAGAVSLYLTDLGPVQMVVDRYMDATLGASFVMDDRHVRVAEMPGRAFTESLLAKSGDAEQRLLVWEGTLEAGSPGAIATLGAFA